MALLPAFGIAQTVSENRGYRDSDKPEPSHPACAGHTEPNMTPEEIVADLNEKNREALHAQNDCRNLTPEQLLALLDAAAMRGFKLGSNVALSMVKGALLVQLTRNTEFNTSKNRS